MAGPQRAESCADVVPALGPIEVGDATAGQHVHGGPSRGVIDLVPDTLRDRRLTAAQQIRVHHDLLSEPMAERGSGATAPSAPLPVSAAASSAVIGRSVNRYSRR